MKKIYTPEKKTRRLEKLVGSMKSIIVAFSGGVDSTFLLKAAVDVLGRDKVMAVVADSETYPKRELNYAVRFARSEKIPYKIITTKELGIKGYNQNPENRCYFCKRELFSSLCRIRDDNGYRAVCDGTNYDDRLDIRHGRRARDELGIISPLEKARFTKEDIRYFSKLLGLKTHDKPSFACLASRIPYHSKITKKRLEKVDRAEDYLRRNGFSQVRVRDYNDLARIELYPRELKKFINGSYRKKVCRYFKSLGYKYVTLDLEGYRTGSMNLS